LLSFARKKYVPTVCQAARVINMFIIRERDVKLGSVDRIMDSYIPVEKVNQLSMIINMCITVDKIVNLPLLYYKQPELHI
jgi:hypothetical protein